jgi:hypothetical protein
MFPKYMYIGTLDRDILKKNVTLKKPRKHIIFIWHPYNVYKPIWNLNYKKPNSLAEFHRCKGWFH